jgi:putative hydrolase of the HAD superfamily
MLKPDQEVFEHVITNLNCAPASVLFIDDNLLNVNAAKAAGMQAQEAKGVQAAERVLMAYGVIR